MSVPNGVSAGAPVAAAWHCENIGPRQRRRRIRIGVALLIVGAAIAALLLGLHAERALRIVVAVPFIAGSIGLFQVRARTCVVFAARKVKNMDQGEVPVTDSRELQTLQRQARLVWIQGFSLGAALTIAALAVG
ncbi:MAG TPA: hypothetical protein VNN72_28750 [Polyangiaceae bacterium]|nr:hypothetical protein [Polyangiaceae bacterium]